MTTTKKSSPKTRVSRKVTVRTEVPGDIRPELRKVYLYVVKNWAVDADEIAKATKLDVKRVRTLLGRLAPLVVGTQVNGEGPLVYQSMYDIENSDETKTLRSARADFAKKFPEAVKDGGNRSGATGATGPRYSDSQIEKGIKAREAGKTNAEVAKAAGVKSPSYFSKILKAEIARRAAASKKPRVTRSKKA